MAIPAMTRSADRRGPRVLTRGAGFLLILLAAFASPWTAHAQIETIAQERSRLAEARKQESEARRRSRRYEMAADRAVDAADKARADAIALGARIQESEARIAATQIRIARIERLRTRQRAALARKQEPVARLLAALQTMARRPSALALIQPGSLDDMIHTRLLLETTTPAIRRNSVVLKAEIEHGNRLRAQADQAMAALRIEQGRIAERRRALARLEQQHRLTSRALDNSAMLERERAQAMGEQARDITTLMQQMDEDALLSARLASLPGPVPRPANPDQAGAPPTEQPQQRTTHPSYRLPVIGRIVTGMGELSDAGVRARGLTFAPAPGALVIAPAGGQVRYAAPFRDYGNVIIIDHGNGWTTLLTGLDQISVRVGDSIGQGSPIGRSPRDRPRIMVELRHQGRPVDIAPLAVRG